MRKETSEHCQLDEKSLDVLRQIEAELERQYDALPESSSHETTAGNMKQSVFSLDYERRKQLILSGKYKEVEQEIRRKKRKQKVTRWTRAAACFLVALLLSFILIGPQNIEAALQHFGQAIMSIFTTHSEFAFPESIAENDVTVWEFQPSFFNAYIPDGFTVKETIQEEQHAYLCAENETGVWFSFNTCDASNSTLALDTEGADEDELLIAGTLVKQYSKETHTILLWEQAGRSCVLSGNQADMLRDLADRIIE